MAVFGVFWAEKGLQKEKMGKKGWLQKREKWAEKGQKKQKKRYKKGKGEITKNIKC